MTVDEVINRITQLLHEQNAADWSVQDKGVLLAAIKLLLENRDEE